MQGFCSVQPVLEGEPLFALYALYGHADKLEGTAVVVYGLGLIGETGVHVGYQAAYVVAGVEGGECIVGPNYAALTIKQQAGYGDVGYYVACGGVVFPEYLIHGGIYRFLVGKGGEKTREEGYYAYRGDKRQQPGRVKAPYAKQYAGQKAGYKQRNKGEMRFFVHIISPE